MHEVTPTVHTVTPSDWNAVLTLAELREIVDLTPDLPGDAVVHVRTKSTWSSHGARVTRLTVVPPKDGAMDRDAPDRSHDADVQLRAAAALAEHYPVRLVIE